MDLKDCNVWIKKIQKKFLKERTSFDYIWKIGFFL